LARHLETAETAYVSPAARILSLLIIRLL